MALSQRQRLAAAVFYLVALVGLSRYLDGSWIPALGLTGLWFYAAAAGLLLGELLIEPYFARPVDAIANAVALLIAVTLVSNSEVKAPSSIINAGRLPLQIYGIGCILLALWSAFLKDRGEFLGASARATTQVVRWIGQARTVYAVLLFFFGYAAFANDPTKLVVLLATWAVIFAGRPIEHLLAVLPIGRITAERGIVEQIIDPRLVLVRSPRRTAPGIGSRVRIGAVEGVVVGVTTIFARARLRVSVPAGSVVEPGADVNILDLLDQADGMVIGHTTDGTNIQEMIVEVSPSAASSGLREGRVVAARIGDGLALYQIVDATVRHKGDADMERQVVALVARKVGIWDEEHSEFQPIAWLPDAGASVLMPEQKPSPQDLTAIGHVPGTDYPVRVNPDRLVAYNAAILGILGIGKTHLAWELVQRCIAGGIKLVALDITGQYAIHLSKFCSPDTQMAIEKRIVEAVKGNRDNKTVRNNEAGNVRDFVNAVSTELETFWAGPGKLLILNPNGFDVTRMEGKPFSGQANQLTEITMVEITRIIAELLLGIAKRDYAPEKEGASRICLVLEEAHSLIPEWNSTVNDAERQAVNGTARSVLQGRKYGFGCLLVTQRTANVTKSILNQCNTVFAMRVYDSTGMEFLANYISDTYSKLLASLPDRECIVFGRASSCRSPIAIQLNDNTWFRDNFWADKEGAVVQTPSDPPAQPAAAAPIPPPPAPNPDDAPF